jgi:transcription antitermination factor NusG
MYPWYVMRTKPWREKIVCSNLERLDALVYCPMAPAYTDRGQQKSVQPLFPGYVFFQIDLEAVGVSRLNYVPGSVGMLELADSIATVPGEFINLLRKRVRSLHESGGIEFSKLIHGDKVRVVDGCLDGYEAIFDSRIRDTDRVRILIEIVGQCRPVELSITQIENLGRVAVPVY